MKRLLRILNGNPARAAASVLIEEARPIVVCTGFPVNGKPETDGPPGAIALVDALVKLKKKVKIASWRELLEIIGKVRPAYPTVDVPIGSAGAVRPVPDVGLVTVEICGQVEDGKYFNMRGLDISSVAPRFESVFGFEAAVSIGDGGNEFGMGSAPERFFAEPAVRRPKSMAKVLVPATTSNYGAYAVVRELEVRSGKRLLPDADEHVGLIRRLVDLGCVDGFSGDAIERVDGVPLDETRRVLIDLALGEGVRGGRSPVGGGDG